MTKETLSQSLSPKQFRAVAALASGCTIEEAAEIAGVSTSAIEKWKKSYEFSQLLERSVNRMYNEALSKMAFYASEATEELYRIIKSEDTPVKYKIQAIEVLFNNAEKARNALKQRRFDECDF